MLFLGSRGGQRLALGKGSAGKIQRRWRAVHGNIQTLVIMQRKKMRKVCSKNARRVHCVELYVCVCSLSRFSGRYGGVGGSRRTFMTPIRMKTFRNDSEHWV